MIKKVSYINSFGDKCIRHGRLIKEGTNYILTPLDSTKKIIIHEDKFKSALEVDDLTSNITNVE